MTNSPNPFPWKLSHLMPEEHDELRLQIVNDFSALWELNNAGHRIHHFSEVEATANYINERMCLGQDSKLIMLAAFFHDMFSWSRFNHHKLSATWIRTTDYPIISALSPEDRELVAQGCEHHRASGTSPFPSVFAELICSADRCWPGQIGEMIKRVIACRMGDPSLSNLEILENGIAHLKEKYGTGGYPRIPQYYSSTFHDVIAKQRIAMDNLRIENGGVVYEDIPFIGLELNA